MLLILEIALGMLAAYAVDAWQLARWLKREREEVWQDWQNSQNWRHVAISWIVVMFAVIALAYVIGR